MRKIDGLNDRYIIFDTIHLAHIGHIKFRADMCNGRVQSSPGSFDSRLATAGYAYSGEATALRMVTDYL